MDNVFSTVTALGHDGSSSEVDINLQLFHWYRFCWLGHTDNTDFVHAGYDRTLRILCRVSCVAPFVKFGDEFIESVMTRMVQRRRVLLPYDWQEYAAKITREYKRVIKDGRSKGVLRFGHNYPMGRINEELAVLRLYDKVGAKRISDAFYSLSKKGHVTKELKELYTRFYHPSSDLFG